MRLAVSILISISILVFFSSESSAQATDVVNARTSQHLIMPFIGYQTLNGEKTGFNYSFGYIDYFETSIDTVDRIGEYERDIYTPELGIVYKYNPIDLLSLELSLSTVHDKVSIRYPIIFESRGFNNKEIISISRRNTMISSLTVLLNLPSPVKTMKPSIRFGGGYAFRDITMDNPGYYLDEKIEAIDAKELYVYRAGIDLSIWSKSNFIIEGSL
ncbi:hypothetical protein H8D57_03080, partial [bacterium]|nr:hypothetical protein [bacterium]